MIEASVLWLMFENVCSNALLLCADEWKVLSKIRAYSVPIENSVLVGPFSVFSHSDFVSGLCPDSHPYQDGRFGTGGKICWITKEYEVQILKTSPRYCLFVSQV